MIIHDFSNDYAEGCDSSILEELIKSNFEQHLGYGDDFYTQEVVKTIRNLIDDPLAEIHLVAGGTLANLLILGAILKPFESVISVHTGHINTREAGAIEATGHKIEEIFSDNGKLSPENIKPVLNKFPKYHTVRSKVVYISNSTEVGSIYTKHELTELSIFCKENNLILFLDGARLAYALASSKNDLTLKDIAQLTDIFYLGGTKCGALLGEAIIITNPELKEDFRYHVKQRGAMMAKGRTLGIQFYKLLENNRIFTLARNANNMVMIFVKGIQDLGYSFYSEPECNQIFPILPNTIIEQLKEKYIFFVWVAISKELSVLRISLSWATPKEKVDLFLEDLKTLSLKIEKTIN